MNVLHGIQPNRSDARGFVHKRIGRAVVGGVKGLIRGGPSGIISGAVTGFISPGGVPTTACPPGFNPSPSGGCVAAVAKVPGVRGTLQRIVPGGATGFEVRAPAARRSAFDEREAARRASLGLAPIAPFAERFPELAGAQADARDVGMGVATVGRFGAGIEPSIRMQDIRDCPRGMVLAVDNLCYNRRDLRNSERFWPRGRRPLLTGGEMRAISTAASAAKKLQRKQKDLMKLGMLPKPTARRAPSRVEGHKATLTHT